MLNTNLTRVEAAQTILDELDPKGARKVISTKESLEEPLTTILTLDDGSTRKMNGLMHTIIMKYHEGDFYDNEMGL